MDICFSRVASAVEETALTEQMRLDLTRLNSLRGMAVIPPDHIMTGWRERVVMLQLGASLFRTMSEPALAAGIRDRDPRLNEIAQRIERVSKTTNGSTALWPGSWGEAPI